MTRHIPDSAHMHAFFTKIIIHGAENVSRLRYIIFAFAAQLSKVTTFRTPNRILVPPHWHPSVQKQSSQRCCPHLAQHLIISWRSNLDLELSNRRHLVSCCFTPHRPTSFQILTLSCRLAATAQPPATEHALLLENALLYEFP
jgi:hypothetical protein